MREVYTLYTIEIIFVEETLFKALILSIHFFWLMLEFTKHVHLITE